MRSTWDLFRDLEALRRELDRVFVPAEGFIGRPSSRSTFLPGLHARGYPLLNISEDEEAVYVEALAPGADPDSLELRTVRDELTISGQKPELDPKIQPDAYHRCERAAGTFTRVITLPAEVDQDKAEAEYRNGLLHIRLPKSEEARPKRIKVGVS